MRVKRIEGRNGTPTEFVEFQVGNTAFVAQRGADEHWFVFQVERGKNGAVVTLEQFPRNGKDQAVQFALAQATWHLANAPA